jgi:hypothetical protein
MILEISIALLIHKRKNHTEGLPATLFWSTAYSPDHILLDCCRRLLTSHPAQDSKTRQLYNISSFTISPADIRISLRTPSSTIHLDSNVLVANSPHNSISNANRYGTLVKVTGRHIDRCCLLHFRFW